ncbi:MAG: hypothetical protein ACR2L9_04845 [Solirubrobacteraceae bacterium]
MCDLAFGCGGESIPLRTLNVTLACGGASLRGPLISFIGKSVAPICGVFSGGQRNFARA